MSKAAPILVTAFEPFGGESVNASWEAVKALPKTMEGHEVVRLLLPVEFGRSADIACEAVAALDPAVVLCVGEAGGRAHLTFERVAVNVMEARMPDNAGSSPQGEPVVAGGPTAYLSTLSPEGCAEAARAAGVPSEVSNSAGLYVCNQLLYRILHATAGATEAPSAVFAHVPYLPEQVICRPGVPCMDAGLAARGLAAALACAVC